VVDSLSKLDVAAKSSTGTQGTDADEGHAQATPAVLHVVVFLLHAKGSIAAT